MASINQLQEKFVYTADRKDMWNLLGTGHWNGDCEDFALTALWLTADKSWLRVWWWVITMQAMLWKAKTAKGPHVMLWVRGKGWIDNWYPEWGPQAQHKKVFPYIAPLLAITLFLK